MATQYKKSLILQLQRLRQRSKVWRNTVRKWKCFSLNMIWI